MRVRAYYYYSYCLLLLPVASYLVANLGMVPARYTAEKRVRFVVRRRWCRYIQKALFKTYQKLRMYVQVGKYKYLCSLLLLLFVLELLRLSWPITTTATTTTTP